MASTPAGLLIHSHKHYLRLVKGLFPFALDGGVDCDVEAGDGEALTGGVGGGEGKTPTSFAGTGGT